MGIRDIVDALEKEFGSLHKAGKVGDFDYQRPQGWKENGARLDSTIGTLEKIRKALKLTPGQMWERLTRR